MIKQIKCLLSSIMMAFVLTIPQMSQAMEAEQEKIEGATKQAIVLFPNVVSVSDTLSLILTEIVKDGCHEYGCHEPGFVGKIRSVCKAWYNFITEERHISPFYMEAKVNSITKCIHDCRFNSDEYMNFYNGVLIFRPTIGSDVGMVRLKFSDCLNLSKGIFNLSGCKDAGNHLSISIGYRKGIIAENKDKVEIWFAPRKLIEQELKEGRAQQFAKIFPEWKANAPIGIFWTWGNWDDLNCFDYLTSSPNLKLCSKNLYKNWNLCPSHQISVWHAFGNFHVYFNIN